MTALVHATLQLRRSSRAAFGFVAAALFGLLPPLGVFHLAADGPSLEQGAVAVAWMVIFASRASARFKAESSGAGLARRDLELGLLLLVAVHASVQLYGGLSGPLYPMVYVLVAFVASFAHAPAGSAMVILAVAYEAPIHFFTEQQQDPKAFGLHALFILFFGVLNLVFTRVEIARVRERSKRQLSDEREKVRQNARMFRLVSAPSREGQGTDDRIFTSSVQEVHHQLYHALTLLHRTLELHTCVFLLLDERGELLHIAELVTTSEDVAPGPFAAGEGVLGAVVRRHLAMNLEHLKSSYKGIGYYSGPVAVKSFLGLPVMQAGRIVGVLCADRVEERPFTPKEEEILSSSVDELLRAMENERVFVQLEASKREQAQLHRASQSLGAALNEDAVMDAALSAIAEIAPYDFAAITTYDAETRKHTVRRATGEHADEIADLVFRDNTSLTAMVVKNKHYLPYRGDFDPRQQTVFTRRANLRGMGSLLILPLIVGEDATGTLVLSARRREAFGNSVRETLTVLANQIAVSLSNSAAVRRLEELATTDGLTGCLNKRVFLDELEKKRRSAERFGRKISLLMTDIDHFKSVNDTYGHATGDVVLKRLGEILRGLKRDTDTVARFGGEEFCVLCEETDMRGAVQLGQRIREALEAEVFHTELGKLKVTLSVGVATYPKDASDSPSLFEAADKALYAAKHGGRNQVCSASR